MRFKQLFMCALISVAVPGLFPAPATAQQNSSTPVIVGTLANFDVVNDQGEETEGFEIQLEGLQKSDVLSTFGQAGFGGLCYIRYCNPQIVPYATGVFVRWTNGYDAAGKTFTSNFNVPNMPLPTVGTPVPAQANIGNLIAGHQCWSQGLGAAYPTSGCEHFGVGLLRNPTATTYRWMVGDPATGVIAAVGGAPVAIAQPVVVVVPPAAPGLPAEVEAVIKAADPVAASHRFGLAEWVKVYKTEIGGRADLDQLIIDGAGDIVPNRNNAAPETEWKLLQFDVANPDKGSSQLKSHGSPHGDSHSVIRRYEFYRYTGPVVAPGGTSGKGGTKLSTDDLEASRCPRDAAGECTAPGPGELGDFIGAQMAAANLGGDVVLINQTINFSLPASVRFGDPALTLTATGGGSGNAVTFAANGNCSVAGNLLTTTGAGSCLVTASQAGNASFAPAAPVTLNLSVAKAVARLIWSPLSPIVYGTPLGASQLSATSTVLGTFTFSPVSGSILPAGAATLRATFVPSDLTNFEGASASVSLNVLRANLTARAADQSRTYGGANPVLTSSISGFVNGESAAVLSGTLDVSTPALQTSPAGSYPIVIAPGTISAANYSFSFAGGTLTVERAGLVVRANDLALDFGDAIPELSASITGFVLFDDLSVLSGTAAVSTIATDSSAPGTYTIVASAGTLSAANYDFSFIPGSLTIAAPRSVLQAVLADLGSYRAVATNTQVTRRLDDAIASLGRAADARLWADDSHPAASQGGAIFDRTKDGVSKLMQAAAATAPADATIQRAITRLANADRGLLVVAIGDAQLRSLDPRRISAAQNELAQATADALQGRFDSAIGHDANGFGTVANR
jgi:hypothetical protein